MFRKPDTTEAEEAVNKHDEATRAFTSLAPGDVSAVEVKTEPEPEFMSENGNGLAKLVKKLLGKK